MWRDDVKQSHGSRSYQGAADSAGALHAVLFVFICQLYPLEHILAAYPQQSYLNCHGHCRYHHVCQNLRITRSIMRRSMDERIKLELGFVPDRRIKKNTPPISYMSCSQFQWIWQYTWLGKCTCRAEENGILPQWIAQWSTPYQNWNDERFSSIDKCCVIY